MVLWTYFWRNSHHKNKYTYQTEWLYSWCTTKYDFFSLINRNGSIVDVIFFYILDDLFQDLTFFKKYFDTLQLAIDFFCFLYCCKFWTELSPLFLKGNHRRNRQFQNICLKLYVSHKDLSSYLHVVLKKNPMRNKDILRHYFMKGFLLKVTKSVLMTSWRWIKTLVILLCSSSSLLFFQL